MSHKGLQRDNNEKFYTSNDVVNLCIEAIKEHININKKDTVIEPSAGNGAFIPAIQLLTKQYKFYDIEPEHDKIKKKDFLTIDYCKKWMHKIVHVIGNPPFGRQSSDAIKFIKLCCKFATTISFILPKSFKKESMKKHFNEYYHLIHEKDLPKNSFTVNNEIHDVPCVFQIWIKKDFPRKMPAKLEPNDSYMFVKKDNHPDISFRRVGVYAGKISHEIENKSEQSHYFIKFNNNKSTEENIEILTKASFVTDNTVGPKSIGKQELIEEFNKLII